MSLKLKLVALLVLIAACTPKADGSDASLVKDSAESVQEASSDAPASDSQDATAGDASLEAGDATSDAKASGDALDVVDSKKD